MNRVMGALSGRLAGIMRRGHIDERAPLDAIAEAGASCQPGRARPPAGLPALPKSVRSTSDRLKVSLGGAWADRPLNQGVRDARRDCARPARPARRGRPIHRPRREQARGNPDGNGRDPGRGRGDGGACDAARRPPRRPALELSGGLDGGLDAAGHAAGGTGLVARLPLGQYASFEWSPDGQHLLVSDKSGSAI